MNKMRFLLAVSLAFNLVVAGIGGFLVYRRGGLAYLKTRVMPTPTVRVVRLSDAQEIFASMPITPRAIVMVGDSLTARCPWPEILSSQTQQPILTRGIGGEGIEGVKDRLDEVLRHQPRQVFLMSGINDLLDGESSAFVVEHVRAIVATIRKRAPQTQIVLQSLLPVNENAAPAVSPEEAQRAQRVLNEAVVQVNRELKSMSNAREIRFVDIHSSLTDESGQLQKRFAVDGLHLSAAGYQVWKEKIESYLN